MSDSDDLFRKLDEMQSRWKNDGFSPVEGEILIFPELEFAVSAISKLRYRGAEQWKVYTGLIRDTCKTVPRNEITLTIE
ncbi:MAG: hypothetical protein CLLPBCKN_008570 [Chroococcidiopsis cubana SAG 39.79]|uniref:Uncharacterized protein n=1 Tax=Chroococcidiopsis cubana SAG 39.79 TaxID=388085 RepID=A0AB37U8P6_9CYAN|nr:hypothetical protein [Chroococcidiopsis cubana SAG 39.79]PSB65150.1 hypothetical protein C7B79_06610 [Chroococcidiopsis cubana CCALA 043]RUT00496.1 hypothetical protein DSM107010_67800 [Chroococcidiopsis cubana SAG 39.79]